MNKAELIDVLTDKLGTDRRQATAAVENVVDTIVRAVHKGDSVTITGFGVFEQRRRAARVARNPRTGETVKVKPTSVPAFRPGAQFKAVVSGAQRLPSEGPAVKRGATASPAKKAAAKKAVKKAATKAPAKKAAATRRPPRRRRPAKKARPSKAPRQEGVRSRRRLRPRRHRGQEGRSGQEGRAPRRHSGSRRRRCRQEGRHQGARPRRRPPRRRAKKAPAKQRSQVTSSGPESVPAQARRGSIGSTACLR